MSSKDKKGKNKKDIEKENQVKELKDLIKDLGGNKTEHSIVMISTAGPVIEDNVQNIDSQTEFHNTKTT